MKHGAIEDADESRRVRGGDGRLLAAAHAARSASGLPVYPGEGLFGVGADQGRIEGAARLRLPTTRRRSSITRLGNRMRIAGTAELSGYSTELNPVRCEALTRRAAEMFPDAGHYDQAAFWTGLRPSTPSNVPLIGATRSQGLYLNTGHGTLGLDHGRGLRQGACGYHLGPRTRSRKRANAFTLIDVRTIAAAKWMVLPHRRNVTVVAWRAAGGLRFVDASLAARDHRRQWQRTRASGGRRLDAAIAAIEHNINGQPLSDGTAAARHVGHTFDKGHMVAVRDVSLTVPTMAWLIAGRSTAAADHLLVAAWPGSVSGRILFEGAAGLSPAAWALRSYRIGIGFRTSTADSPPRVLGRHVRDTRSPRSPPRATFARGQVLAPAVRPQSSRAASAARDRAPGTSPNAPRPAAVDEPTSNLATRHSAAFPQELLPGAPPAARINAIVT